MPVEIKQMVVKSEVKESQPASSQQGNDQQVSTSAGSDMNCNQTTAVVIDGCMRQIKRNSDKQRVR